MDRVNIWYWNYKRNSGDAMASHVLRHVLGLEPVFASRETDHVLTIGSVLSHATPLSYVWGSGVLDPNERAPITAGRVRAVRGRLTLKWLRDRGIAVGDVPLGDPAILVDRLPIGTAAPVRLAVVPHHEDSGLAARFGGRDDVAVVGMRDDTLAPLARIAAAEAVASESLHGLIYAEALGKPSVWVSGRRDGLWRFKFQDWYSTTAEPQRDPLPLDTDAASLVAAARLAGCTIDRAALLDAFPRDPMEVRSGALVGFEQCRAVGMLSAAIETPLFPALRRADSFDDAEIEALQWRIVEAMTEILGRWAQPVYLCLHHGPAPDPGLLRRAVAHLDAVTRYEFALIRARDAGDPATPLDDAGRRLGGALVLRPVGWFSPRKPFATVFSD